MSVILPGSYDPVTKGHLDIIRRVAEKYDEVYVVVFTNPNKNYMFSVEDRVRMLMLATDDLDNVLVSYSNGLVIDYMTDHEIEKIIKGYRTEADLEWERAQADWNFKHGRYETELWKCADGLENISSTAAREAIMENEPLDMLPEKVAKYLEEKFNQALKERSDSLIKSLNVDSEIPKLTIGQFTLTPCRPDIPDGCFAQNLGGSGKGISIMFIGDYVESGDITFDDVSFCYMNRKGETTQKAITLEKTKLSDNTYAYCFTDDNFVIPPYKAPTVKEFEESFGVRFTPRGNNRKFLDITIVFIPHGNWTDGQCYWRVWAHHPSKREYIEENNNRILEDVNEHGIPRECVEGLLINPDAYDLD